jgi:hypothetical protein
MCGSGSVAIRRSALEEPLPARFVVLANAYPLPDGSCIGQGIGVGLGIVDDRYSVYFATHDKRQRGSSGPLDADRDEPDQVGRTGSRGKGTPIDSRSVRAGSVSADDERSTFVRTGSRAGSGEVLRKLACLIRLHCPTLTVLFWAVLWLFEESNTIQVVLMGATLAASVVVHVYEVSHRDGR